MPCIGNKARCNSWANDNISLEGRWLVFFKMNIPTGVWGIWNHIICPYTDWLLLVLLYFLYDCTLESNYRGYFVSIDHGRASPSTTQPRSLYHTKVTS